MNIGYRLRVFFSIENLKWKIRSAMPQNFTCNATVITFHRIDNKNIFAPSIESKDFESLIEEWRRNYKIISIDELNENNSNKSLIITFDDIDTKTLERIDFYTKKYDIPVLIFVATSRLEKKLEWMWIDAIDSIINSNDENKISAMKGIFSIPDLSVISIRKVAVRMIKNTDINLIKKLIDLSGDSLEKYPKLLGDKEIQLCKNNRNIVIGAHTGAHFSLRRLSSSAIKNEIQESIRVLQKCQIDVKYFAYPYGGRLDYDGRSFGELKKAGIQMAFTTEESNQFLSIRKYSIPRFSYLKK
ncbi:polysaccharide deacetylase family protein [Polynucleobacter sp. MWH-S4W17]|uniref:polysaccharide deacetylase family protein n=1 Tax=Polynucleobacter sp. MWH-S4W17 TaxID=1855910 RepID=UPI001BFD4F44|nr:polysaccharide deacetylase family protein [Polynucleobacter sp. MWH-S4W17]QWD81925.1 polysaccharide deacetylase family protein [Polynucleobacter sp. MWH-S4W17]